MSLDFRFQRNDSVSNGYFLSLFLVIVCRSVCSGFQARREAGLFLSLLFDLATESQGTRQGGLLFGKPTRLFCSIRKGIKKQKSYEMVDD